MPYRNLYLSEKADAYVNEQPPGYIHRLVKNDMKGVDVKVEKIKKDIPKKKGDGKNTCKSCGSVLPYYKGKCKNCT